VRHFFILAALTLTACGLPGALGTTSFMSATHPTQEACASRGLTLDPTTKQCVTPPTTPSTPSASAESVTGSLPKFVPVPSGDPTPAAPLQPQPPPLERQRSGPTVSVEPDAVIHPQLSQDSDLMSELARFVRASGYRCDSISALEPFPSSDGFTLVCNRFSYKYAIENKNGRSTVTVE
jgi:hypothetical protein